VGSRGVPSSPRPPPEADAFFVIECLILEEKLIKRQKYYHNKLGSAEHLLDGHSEERPISAQPYLGGCYRTGSE